VSENSATVTKFKKRVYEQFSRNEKYTHIRNVGICNNVNKISNSPL
jgi:hypothetical protein